MNLVDRLLSALGISNKDAKAESESKFKPVEKPPIDEEFTLNFKENGGKFIYCSNKADLKESFQSIIDENHWQDAKVSYRKESLFNKFGQFYKLNAADKGHEDYLLTDCEFLIANTGAILMSSDQIGEKKPEELPYNIIVYATTSQLIETISLGLQNINTKHKNQIPTNIRTLKTFREKDDVDFMSYGSISKNLYLLLLEDL